jgi:hypothetical protein
MGIADKNALLAKRADTATGFPEDTVTIPGIGDVLVRALSRFEVMAVQKAKGPLMVERATVAFGMVDPVMTEADVAEWQKVSVGGELDKVSQRIGQLSGMLADAPKQAYKEFEEEPGSEFRVLPGAEAGDDGVAASGGDE